METVPCQSTLPYWKETEMQLRVESSNLLTEMSCYLRFADKGLDVPFTSIGLGNMSEALKSTQCLNKPTTKTKLSPSQTATHWRFLLVTWRRASLGASPRVPGATRSWWLCSRDKVEAGSRRKGSGHTQKSAELTWMGWGRWEASGQTHPVPPLQKDIRALSYLSAGPGRQNLTGPVRYVTGPVREAVLIKFGSIIAGFVLWPHYGFFKSC